MITAIQRNCAHEIITFEATDSDDTVVKKYFTLEGSLKKTKMLDLKIYRSRRGYLRSLPDGLTQDLFRTILSEDTQNCRILASDE